MDKRIFWFFADGTHAITLPLETPRKGESDDAFIARMRARVVEATTDPSRFTSAINVLTVNTSDLPPLAGFGRTIWKDNGDGTIGIDMAKARTVHMDRIRVQRNKKLEEVSGSRVPHPPEIEAIFTPARKAELQQLRDIPQTFELSGATTVEDLTLLWPSGLERP